MTTLSPLNHWHFLCANKKLPGDTKLSEAIWFSKRRFFGKFVLIFCKAVWKVFWRKAVSSFYNRLSKLECLLWLVDGSTVKAKSKSYWLIRFFLSSKMETSVRIARHVCYNLHVLRRRMLQLLPSSQSRWPEETKAVAEPESLEWSPRNAGIVIIDWGVVRIVFFLSVKNEYICL